MVRTAGLRSFLRRILRFTTPGRPGAVAACYVALWRLPRPDSHRLVIGAFQGTPARCWLSTALHHQRVRPNSDVVSYASVLSELWGVAASTEYRQFNSIDNGGID